MENRLKLSLPDISNYNTNKPTKLVPLFDKAGLQKYQDSIINSH
jgi:hypothetical protein